MNPATAGQRSSAGGPPRSISVDSHSSLANLATGGGTSNSRIPKTSPSADHLPAHGKRGFGMSFMPEEGNPYEEVLKHEHAWTVRDIGQNAISGILNDVVGQQSKLGLKPLKGMESVNPVPPTVVRRIRDQEFDNYRRSLADVFDKYQYNRAVGLAAALEGTPILALGDQQAHSFANLTDLTDKYGLTDLSHYSQFTKPNRKGLTQVQRTRILSVNAPPLDSVPNVFFEPNFDLANPHTFDTVCENADITSPGNPEATVTNAALQEKLSNYLDTVEVHLIKEISRRSSSFFSALSTLQALHRETHDCVTQIQSLRQKLSSVSNSSARKGVEVVQLKRRRGNLGLMYGAMKLVAEVKQTQPMIQVLLNQGDYVAALDLIEETSLILRGKSMESGDEVGVIAPETFLNGIVLTRSRSVMPRSLDLRGVKGLTHLNGQLTEMSRLIGKMIENEFISVIISDVRNTVMQMESSGTRIAPKIQASPVAGWVRNILSGNFTSTPGTPTVNVPSLLGLSDEEALTTRLTPLIFGLLRMDRLSTTLQSYKEALVSEIKSMTRRLYPAVLLGNDDHSVTSPTSLQSRKIEAQSARAKQLRSMTFDAFFNLMISVYVTVLHILHRVAIIHEIQAGIIKTSQDRGVVIGGKIIDFTTIAAEPADDLGGNRLKPKTAKPDDDDDLGSIDMLNVPDEEALRAAVQQPATVALPRENGRSTFAQMIQESSEIVYSASDFSHVRCAKLIGVRSEQNAQLNPKDFFRLFGATWEFVAAGETLAGRMCYGLKGTMLSQAKSFLTHFHDEKSKQMALLIENEQWVQTEVPIDFQRIGQSLIISGRIAASPPAPGSTLRRSADGYDEPFSHGNSEENLDDEADLSTGGFSDERVSPSSKSPTRGKAPVVPDGKSLKYLVLDHQKFYVVNSVLMFLKMLTDYLQCVEYIPALTTDVLNRISELLKLFNSRTCQVILGAGAMRSAGLKNITARHIALAAQALSVVIVIIPHLRNAIQKHLSIKQQVLLTDFDRLLRDFRDHQNELYSKLVSIMNERLTVHCRSLQTINWDSPPPRDTNSEEDASPYMVLLVKETATLHKVLSKYLTPPTLKTIMIDVFKAYNERLEMEIKKVELYSSSSKNRLLIDVQFFIQRLSALDGIDGPGNHLEVVVNNMKIRDKRDRPSMSGMNSSPSMTFTPPSNQPSTTSLTSAPTGMSRRPSFTGIHNVGASTTNTTAPTSTPASSGRPGSLDGTHQQHHASSNNLGSSGAAPAPPANTAGSSTMFKGFNFSREPSGNSMFGGQGGGPAIANATSAGAGGAAGVAGNPGSPAGAAAQGSKFSSTFGQMLRAQNKSLYVPKAPGTEEEKQ